MRYPGKLCPVTLCIFQCRICTYLFYKPCKRSGNIVRRLLFCSFYCFRHFPIVREICYFCRRDYYSLCRRCRFIHLTR